MRSPPIRAAKAAFAKLSFTHQREYVEWVEEAKRPETRARRIAGTVERVREGQAAALMARLHGAIAAASTPLRAAASELDEAAFGPYADFLAEAGLDGVLAFGTNGEAVLLSLDERRRGLELWLEAVAGRMLVAAHCGAQTTADTVALAAHAAEAGADAVAVIGPPYFKLDPAAQRAHLLAAASACAPLPFYVYEFAATAGYAFDPAMLARLREEAENLVGMKVSDTPWDAFERYVLDGFDIFVGPEALIHRGREAGAVGSGVGARLGVPARGGRGRPRADRRGRGARSRTSARASRRSPDTRR